MSGSGAGWGARRRWWCGCWRNALGKEYSSLARFSKDLFVEAAKRRWLARFLLKWGWIRDMSDFAYTEHKCVGDFFNEWGGFGFRGVYWFVNDV